MRIAVVGTGLIGGSIGLALAALGHDVVGFDRDRRPARRARSSWVRSDRSPPISASAARRRRCRVRRAARRRDRRRGRAAARGGRAARHRRGFGEGSGRRRGRSRRCPDGAARFIGGHPMAGSEQEGIDGARADVFVGAAWVLTPTPATAEDCVHDAARAVARAAGRGRGGDARTTTTCSSRS